MNVLELIKSLGPKADANKIWLVLKTTVPLGAHPEKSYLGQVGWGDNILYAESYSEKDAKKVLESLASDVEGADIDVSVGVRTLAECGWAIHWDSTFAENGDFRAQPELLENTRVTCDYKGMIAAAKQALKEYLDEAKEAVKSAENKVKAEKRDLISAEKYVAAGFRSIAPATGAKPRPKKKLVAIKIRKFSVAGKGDQPQKLPKKTKKKEKKKLLRAVKAASRKKKRK